MNNHDRKAESGDFRWPVRRWKVSIQWRNRAIRLLAAGEPSQIVWLEEHSGRESLEAFGDHDGLRAVHGLMTFVLSRSTNAEARLCACRSGSDTWVLGRRWALGSREERMALLENPWIGQFLPREDAFEILRNPDSRLRELELLALNERLPRYFLVDAIETLLDGSEEGERSLLVLLAALTKGPILSSREGFASGIGLDEFLDEREFVKLNRVLLTLAGQLRVSFLAANVLCRVYERLVFPYDSAIPEGEILRWSDPSLEEGSYEEFCFRLLRTTLVEKQTAALRRVPERDRSELSILHNDPGIRIGLYRSLTPWELFEKGFWVDNYYKDDPYQSDIRDPEGKCSKIARQCFEQDGFEFVDGVSVNSNFWRTAEGRAILDYLRFMFPNRLREGFDPYDPFPSIRKGFEERHPEFFHDEESAEYASDPHRDLMQRLDLLEAQNKVIAREVQRVLTSKIIQNEPFITSALYATAILVAAMALFDL